MDLHGRSDAQLRRRRRLSRPAKSLTGPHSRVFPRRKRPLHLARRFETEEENAVGCFCLTNLH
jgi:hypothetical protein